MKTAYGQSKALITTMDVLVFSLLILEAAIFRYAEQSVISLLGVFLSAGLLVVARKLSRL